MHTAHTTHIISKLAAYVLSGAQRRRITDGTDQNMIAIEGHRKHIRNFFFAFLCATYIYVLYILIQLYRMEFAGLLCFVAHTFN